MTIKVRLTNRMALLSGYSDEAYEKLQDFWSFSPKGLWFMPRYKATGKMIRERKTNMEALERIRRISPEKKFRIQQLEEIIATQTNLLSRMWDGKIRFLKRHALPAGLFRATRLEATQKLGVAFEVIRERENLMETDGIPFSNDEQYLHQDVCVKRMMAATHKGGGTILSATGTGKTRIAAMYFSRVCCQCLFVVDQLDLLYQQKEELEQWLGEEVGVVGESKFNVKRVTVATIQTLDIHIDSPEFRRWYADVQAMIVDELHEQMGRRNFDVLEEISPVAVFGLTATLQMGQKEVRYKVFAFAGPIIFEFPITKGIARGALNPVVVLQLLFPEIDEGTNDIYLEDIVKQVVENNEKQSACQGIVHLLHTHGRYVIVLSDRVAQLMNVRDMFQSVKHGIAYGTIPTAERRKAIAEFEDGVSRLILANKVFKKGVNVKRVDSMIDMAEMKSKNDVVQKLGRTVRLHPDKGMALYIDFGTQTGRFATAARSRKRALTKAGIEVKTVKVSNAVAAVTAVEKFLKKDVMDAIPTSGSLFEAHPREAGADKKLPHSAGKAASAP